MAWTPIVGRAFTKDEFSAYVKGINIPQWPQFVALHNTDAPDLKTYAGYQTRKPPVTDQQWLKNLEHNYRDLQHWSSGPHLFIVPKERGILAFTPLTARGTHSPSWNGIAWAIEMVGNYTRDAFDSGDGAIVRDNAVHALAVLHIARGLDPKTLKLHKEDPRTTHALAPARTW
jgi:hypothetical protein